MPEFLKLLPPLEALEKFLVAINAEPLWEEIATINALGRVTAEPVFAPYPLPSFARTTVDGYAVRSADTYGAGESLPAYLSLVGEVPMGGVPDFSIKSAQCALIHTGGMLPSGADAVVMVENTQIAKENEVEIMRSVAVGENVLHIGEDVKKGEEVIPSGTRLRPSEIGGLMALGFIRVPVAIKPKVGIISSGDEVIPPGSEISPGQVRDVNTYTLGALIENSGGEPVSYGIVPDELEVMREMTARARSECDIVVVTAGSSASARDLTSQVIDGLGKPGVLVHGVDVRPGKPTILGVCDGIAVIGLPGNPVSALVIAGLFVVPVIEKLLGVSKKHIRPFVPAQLTVNLASQTGREDWVAVQIIDSEEGFLADPIFGKSNLIFTLAKADGLIRIPADANGLSAGERVNVFLM